MWEKNVSKNLFFIHSKLQGNRPIPIIIPLFVVRWSESFIWKCKMCNSPGCYVISLKFFGRGSSYTFLESLEPIQLQEQCCHFFRHRPLTFLAVTTSGFTVFRGYTSDNATFWIGVRTKKVSMTKMHVSWKFEQNRKYHFLVMAV